MTDVHTVLNTIRTRYMQHLIYTYSGIVLIAVNPFDRVALYDPDIVQQYSGKRRGELEPHLFAIAEDAYRCMIREQMNQTIVVSGERYVTNQVCSSSSSQAPFQWCRQDSERKIYHALFCHCRWSGVRGQEEEAERRDDWGRGADFR